MTSVHSETSHDHDSLFRGAGDKNGNIVNQILITPKKNSLLASRIMTPSTNGTNKRLAFLDGKDEELLMIPSPCLTTSRKKNKKNDEDLDLIRPPTPTSSKTTSREGKHRCWKCPLCTFKTTAVNHTCLSTAIRNHLRKFHEEDWKTAVETNI